MTRREKQLRAALVAITKLGRVCNDFEFCEHEACADSCAAVLIALDALRDIKAKRHKAKARQELHK